jgi:hypothetical protein
MNGVGFSPFGGGAAAWSPTREEVLTFSPLACVRPPPRLIALRPLALPLLYSLSSPPPSRSSPPPLHLSCSPPLLPFSPLPTCRLASCCPIPPPRPQPLPAPSSPLPLVRFPRPLPTFLPPSARRGRLALGALGCSFSEGDACRLCPPACCLRPFADNAGLKDRPSERFPRARTGEGSTGRGRRAGGWGR